MCLTLDGGINFNLQIVVEVMLNGIHGGDFKRINFA